MKNWMDWLLRRGERKPPAPVSGRRRIDLGPARPQYPIYVIGDVHGCITELREAEARIAEDIQAAQKIGLVILLGDYVDRGPSSRQVIDHLISPSSLGLRRLPLCGNHDDVFSKVLENPELHSEWLRIGGEPTLLSYGIDMQYIMSQPKGRRTQFADLLTESVPPTHRHFLKTLPVSLQVGDLLFVHAGIRPGVPVEEQDEEDMMWIREPFISEGPQLPLLVIHGHTPAPDADLGPNRIGVDTGAYYSGRLTVLKVDGDKAYVL